MDILSRIRTLDTKDQQFILKKISHVISNRDLKHIMEDVYHGVPIIRAHQRQGIFTRYEADIIRFLDQLDT